MNTPNPLIPQGTLPTRRRSHVRIAVFSILAIHVVLLGALLLQGCKRTAQNEANLGASNESLIATWVEPANPTPVVSVPTPPPPVPPMDTDTTYRPPAPVLVPVVETTRIQPPPPVPPPAGGGTTHVVVKNDSFFTLGKKYNVTSKAIADANPGVESSRLKLGQKLNIPPPAPATHALVSPPGNGHSAVGVGKTYVVKSGDNLTRIAKDHGTTIGKLRAANHLMTDSIKVGQKLVIPMNGGRQRTEPVPGIDPTAPAPRFP